MENSTSDISMMDRITQVLSAPVTLFAFAGLLMGLCLAIMLNNDYMSARDVAVTVMERNIVPKTSKVSEKKELVYKSDDGIIFRQRVSESTYKTSPIGEQYKVYVRPFDMKQTVKENAIFFFGPIFIGTLSMGFAISAMIAFFERRSRRK